MSKILLVGVKHCGKSSAGRRLAARMGCVFVDCDAEIESRDAAANGGVKRSTREIFRAVGAEEFRRLELQALFAILEREEDLVAAAGGGLAETPDLDWSAVRARAKVVFLETPEPVLWERISRKPELPAYLPPEPEAARRELAVINSRRRAVYSKEAHAVIVTAGRSDETALRIMRLCR